MADHVTIHRGSIPGTQIGHHWFAAADGHRYGVDGGPGPDGGNKGFHYVIVDVDGQGVDDSCRRLVDVSEWAREQRPGPDLTSYEMETLWLAVLALLESGDAADAFPAERHPSFRVEALQRVHRKFQQAYE